MRAETIRSRKAKENKVTIILEMNSSENADLLKKELKKAVHYWNRLLSKKLSFNILIVKPDSRNYQEVQQHQSDHKQ